MIAKMGNDVFTFSFSGESPQPVDASTGQAAVEADIGPKAALATEIAPVHAAATAGVAQEVVVASSLTLIKHVLSTSDAAALLEQQGVADSDLLPGQYEGGFKLWEGGLDLAAFLASPEHALGDVEGAHVLELGCGHGLPGLVLLLGGAIVHFQDYNAEVLQALTMPNVAANWNRASVSTLSSGPPPVRYFSGDWLSMPSLLLPLGLCGTYDIILSTETIYSVPAMHSLYACIEQCLKRPSGVAYIAAKSYYFGVGGSVAAFLDVVRKANAMTGEVVQVIEDGASVKREIIRLTWK